MNDHLDPGRTGLAVGALVGGWHLVWSLLVAIGWAQAFIDVSLWAHMISMPVAVNTFDFSTAVVLVLITGALGYIGGYLFARVWNWLHRSPVSMQNQ